MSVPVRAIGRLGPLIPDALIARMLRSGRACDRMLRLLDSAIPASAALEEIRIATGPAAGLKVIANRRNYAAWFGAYERWVQQALCRYARPGMTLWDVGAFTGFHTLLMRRIAGAGRVVAIEPDPRNHDRLAANLRLNGYADVLCLPVAVGARTGMARLNRSPDRPSQSALDEAAEGQCEVVTFDALLDRLPTPGLIKMDIEGSEAAALSGAPRLLKEIRPTWIIEGHAAAGDLAMEQLRSADYRIVENDRQENAPGRLIGGAAAHFLAIPQERA